MTGDLCWSPAPARSRAGDAVKQSHTKQCQTWKAKATRKTMVSRLWINRTLGASRLRRTASSIHSPRPQSAANVASANPPVITSRCETRVMMGNNTAACAVAVSSASYAEVFTRRATTAPSDPASRSSPSPSAKSGTCVRRFTSRRV